MSEQIQLLCAFNNLHFTGKVWRTQEISPPDAVFPTYRQRPHMREQRHRPREGGRDGVAAHLLCPGTAGTMRSPRASHQHVTHPLASDTKHSFWLWRRIDAPNRCVIKTRMKPRNGINERNNTKRNKGICLLPTYDDEAMKCPRYRVPLPCPPARQGSASGLERQRPHGAVSPSAGLEVGHRDGNISPPNRHKCLLGIC